MQPDFKVIKTSGASLSEATKKLEEVINPLIVKGYDLVGGVSVIETKAGHWTVVQSIFRKGSCTLTSKVLVPVPPKTADINKPLCLLKSGGLCFCPICS